MPADAAAPKPAPTLAQLTAARQERDAAIAQRDAALDQVRQLRDDLAYGRAAAPSQTSAADAARLTQLQRDRDTLRYVAGPKKLLMANKVIESHLYLLPPPSDLLPLNVGQTSEITLDGQAYGMNKVKDLLVIPSSVWEGSDYRLHDHRHDGEVHDPEAGVVSGVREVLRDPAEQLTARLRAK